MEIAPQGKDKLGHGHALQGDHGLVNTMHGNRNRNRNG